MSFAGFDSDTYPGDKTMEWLWDSANTNFWWVGYYLPEKGSPQTWKGKYTHLKTMGWGVAPLYLGKQPQTLSSGRFRGKEKLEGYMDGIAATSMAANDMMPNGTVIYFDLENKQGMPNLASGFADYYTSWMKCVIDRGYLPGLYCSPLFAPFMASVMFDIQGPPLIWAAYYPDRLKKPQKNPYPTEAPARSGYPLACSWQLAGNHFIAGPGKTSIKVDLGTSFWKDPGLRIA